jgi:ankyrin repeat protein
LIDAGANINAASLRGWTPLLAAVYGGAAESMRMLIQAGADLQRRDQENHSAYDIAVAHGNYEFASELKGGKVKKQGEHVEHDSAPAIAGAAIKDKSR